MLGEHVRTTHAACPAGARRPPPSKAAGWLAGSRDGHCGITSGEGRCDVGDQGSWPLARLIGKADARGRWTDTRGAPTWSMAATACLRRCARCARCRHVSVSLRHWDCSWYWACPSELQPVPYGIRTGSLALWQSQKCVKPLQPIVRAVSPTAWLNRSVAGLCGVTEPDASHSCDHDDAGTWPLAKTFGLRASATGPEAWARAAAACTQRCTSCARCRFLSISLRNAECSWYSTCEALAVSPIGYRTAAIDSDGSSGGAPSRELAGRSNGGATAAMVGAGVSPSTASSDLDQAHLLTAALPASPADEADATSTEFGAGAGDNGGTLLLLAVFSGSEARRATIRCTWGSRLHMRSGGAVRLRFVVGESVGFAAGAAADIVERPPDELVAPVREGQRAHRTDPHLTQSRVREVQRGTISKQLSMLPGRVEPWAIGPVSPVRSRPCAPPRDRDDSLPPLGGGACSGAIAGYGGRRCLCLSHDARDPRAADRGAPTRHWR